VTAVLKTPASWPAILLRRDDAPVEPPKRGTRGSTSGFEGLRRTVRELGSAGTIALIAEAGLRGRGGAGYPTAEKWRAAASAEAPAKYVVANGYGADPSSLTDRTLMEREPAAVIEGAAIAAWVIGAEEALIAVRAGSTDAITALEGAIASALAAGDLGDDAMGSGRRLVVEIRTVQGAYMLGEETVLLKAIEGKRGQPEQRPPLSAAAVGCPRGCSENRSRQRAAGRAPDRRRSYWCRRYSCEDWPGTRKARQKSRCLPWPSWRRNS